MRLTRLCVYPVKSCGGISVPRARLAPRGFAGDRRWMLVDDRGRFMTQRHTPQMSQIRSALGPDGLTLWASGHSPLAMPASLDAGNPVEVDVWGDRCTALVHHGASAWASEVLGRDVRVVYMPEDAQRRDSDDTGLVSFADGFPYLLTTEVSLADLNGRLETPVEMDRFRPNIVVDGTEPFAEDGWDAVTIGEVRFRVAKPCERCVLTTVDPRTGVKGKEPLKTLATYRKIDGAVLFGVNLVALGGGEVAVGDVARVD